MSQPEPIEFALKGTVDGVEITPQRVPFGLLKKFHEEVEQLVLGSNQGSLANTLVEVAKGSYALIVPPPETLREGLEKDLNALMDSADLGLVDPRRAQIVEGWQRRVTMETTLSYHVRPRSQEAGFREVAITPHSTYRRATTDRWVEVQRMILGFVEDAGGRQRSSNLHVIPRGQKTAIIVTVSRDQVREEAYPVYREKLLHVSAERNLRTGALRKFRLIRFVPYQPQFDAAKFERMTAAGAKAWGDVLDAAAWVRDLRGGMHA